MFSGKNADEGGLRPYVWYPRCPEIFGLEGGGGGQFVAIFSHNTSSPIHHTQLSSMPTPTVSNVKKSYGSTEPTLTRNEVSVGGGTAITNETEPLLGEKWLDDRASTPASKADDTNTKPFYTDASTIDVEDSVIDDPHIGINVVTNDYNQDSMSYSRDDSTLGIGDRYFRTPKNGSRLTMEGSAEAPGQICLIQ